MKTLINFSRAILIIAVLIIFCPITPFVWVFFNSAWFIWAWFGFNLILFGVVGYCMMAMAQAADAYDGIYHEYDY